MEMTNKMTTTELLLYFEEEKNQATQIANAAGMALACISRHRFPDGELKLRLPDTLSPRVTLLRSLHQPNEKLLELLLVARTARTLGAKHLTLVAPYLAYMRQDIAFQPGEAVSQRIVGGFLADLFDAVITVDPHLHRISTLQEAIPAPHAIVLSGAPLLADWIALQRKHPLLIGPDEESAQWIAQAAKRHGFDFAVCQKIRHGDRSVEATLPHADIAGRAVVLLDDIASSGCKWVTSRSTVPAFCTPTPNASMAKISTSVLPSIARQASSGSMHRVRNTSATPATASASIG